MQPVTLKSKQLIHSLVFVQVLLLAVSVLTVVFALAVAYWYLILLPFILGFMYRNHHQLNLQKPFHLVLNAENHWHLVHRKSNQVAEAQLLSSWRTPFIIALKLSSKHGSHWYMMSRQKLGAEKYARIWVGLEND